MINILQSLSKTVHLSLGIAILLLLGLHFFGDGFSFDRYFYSWLFRYLHVLTGIMWIGLLWYFNFVQIPSMPNIPDEQKPAIGKVIAPKALFWFRWAALGTIVTGMKNCHEENEAASALAPPKAKRTPMMPPISRTQSSKSSKSNFSRWSSCHWVPPSGRRRPP